MSTVTDGVDTGARTPPPPPRTSVRRLGPSWRLRLNQAASYLMLGLLAVIYIYPFLISVANSMKTDPESVAKPLSLIPDTWSFAAYDRLFTEVPLPQWAANTLLVTLFITLGRVFFNSLAGYALSRLQFRGRTVLFVAFIGVLSVPNVVLLIPRFLVLNQLGMFNTYAGMIVPLLVDAAGIFIMKQFFDSIPVSIEEAARIDGAGVFRTFWTIVLPMARPAVVTIFILSFQGSWNEFAHFIVSRNDPELNTLTTGVASLVSGELGQGNQYPLQLAAAVLMTIPVAILFFVFQRRIMNTTAGAEKG